MFSKKLILLLSILFGIICFENISFANEQAIIAFHDPLVDAAENSSETDVVNLLRSGVDVNSKGDFGVTALMRASFRGNSRIVRILLSVGSDPNLHDIGGATALHMAARAGHAKIVKILLKHDADIDARDHDGFTPLMRAAMTGKANTIKSLLEANANVKLKNKYDQTAPMLAVQSNDYKSVKIFADSGDLQSLNSSEQRKIVTLANHKGNKAIENILQAALDETNVISGNKVQKVELFEKKPVANNNLEPKYIEGGDKYEEQKVNNKIVRLKEKAPTVMSSKEESLYQESMIRPIEDTPIEDDLVKNSQTKQQIHKNGNAALANAKKSPLANGKNHSNAVPLFENFRNFRIGNLVPDFKNPKIEPAGKNFAISSYNIKPNNWSDKRNEMMISGILQHPVKQKSNIKYNNNPNLFAKKSKPKVKEDFVMANKTPKVKVINKPKSNNLVKETPQESFMDAPKQAMANKQVESSEHVKFRIPEAIRVPVSEPIDKRKIEMARKAAEKLDENQVTKVKWLKIKDIDKGLELNKIYSLVRNHPKLSGYQVNNNQLNTKVVEVKIGPVLDREEAIKVCSLVTLKRQNCSLATEIIALKENPPIEKELN